MTSYHDLAALRSQMLGFSRAFVAREARIEVARLACIEDGEPPTMAELERLANLYGVDEDALAEQPIDVSSDAIMALPLLDEFKEIS